MKHVKIYTCVPICYTHIPLRIQVARRIIINLGLHMFSKLEYTRCELWKQKLIFNRCGTGTGCELWKQKLIFNRPGTGTGVAGAVL